MAGRLCKLPKHHAVNEKTAETPPDTTRNQWVRSSSNNNNNSEIRAMSKSKFLALGVATLLTVGCAADDPNRRAKTGAAIGAVAGAVVGNQHLSLIHI